MKVQTFHFFKYALSMAKIEKEAVSKCFL